MDTSVEFADDGNGKPYLWAPECADDLGRIFEIIDGRDIVIDGRGTGIDIAIPIMRGSIEDYYANAAPQMGANPVLRESTWLPRISAFFINQPESAGGAGTMVRNFVTMGFHRVIETHHDHRGSLVVERCLMLRSLIAVFARGQNVTIRNCVIKDSLNCGVYGEYGSRGWVFEGCLFGDNSVNAQAQSFADIVLDACYEYLIKRNKFAKASVPASRIPSHRTAISLYRNSGELGDIREHAAHHIQIENNVFEEYHLAVDIGARAGVIDSKDRSLEGRCYTHDITVQENQFNSCKIAIKINADQNRITNNRFSGCQRDIVIQCVFYKTLNQHITQAEGEAGVWLWSQQQDMRGFEDYCFYQSASSGRVFLQIPDHDRLFHLALKGAVTLHKPTRKDFTAKVLIEESLLSGETFQGMIASGATPIDVAVANYADHIEGDEIAVIWDTPVSRIGSQDYYSIIIYDQWGLELDRCGRSTVKWKAIAGGNLIPGKGWIHVNSEAEVAAITEEPDPGGKYPVYIFRRGFGLDEKNLSDKGVLRLMENNRMPLHDVTVGDFVPGNDYLEVAVIPTPEQVAGGKKIYYLDPRNMNWIGESDGLEKPLVKIAAGKFDMNTAGEQVAGICGGVSSIYLFKPGAADGPYSMVEGSEGEWAALGAGNLDGYRENGDEIVVASDIVENGVFPLKYFHPLSGIYNSYEGEELSIKPRSLDVGSIVTGESLGVGERITGGSVEGNVGAEIGRWGEHVALLPSEAKDGGIPLFWIAIEPGDSLAIEGAFSREIFPYGISFRSIVPRRNECTNLLVPVCLSASHVAYGSINTEPVFMALGQSSGAAAALSIADDIAVQDIPYRSLRGLLEQRGQRLPETNELQAVIIDDEDAEYTGEWERGNEGAYIGIGYRTSIQPDGESRVFFRFSVPSDGEYEVRFLYRRNSGFSDNGRVLVSTGNTEVECHVDFTGPENDKPEASLGTYYFMKERAGLVMLESGKLPVSVDAVMLVPRKVSGPVITNANDLLIYALAENYTILEDGSFSTRGDLSYLPMIHFDPAGQSLALAFVPRSRGVLYRVQLSTDLLDWINLDTPVSNLHQTQTIVSPLPVNMGDRQFLRLKVSLDPESSLDVRGTAAWVPTSALDKAWDKGRSQASCRSFLTCNIQP